MTFLSSPRALLVIVVVLGSFVLGASIGVGPVRASAEGAQPSAFYCEYPTHVTVGSKTISTPTICVPIPGLSAAVAL